MKKATYRPVVVYQNYSTAVVRLTALQYYAEVRVITINRGVNFSPVGATAVDHLLVKSLLRPHGFQIGAIPCGIQAAAARVVQVCYAIVSAVDTVESVNTTGVSPPHVCLVDDAMLVC